MNVAHVYDIYTDGRLSGRQIVNIESKKEGVYLCLTSKLETFLGVEVVQMVVENEKHHLKRICVEKMYNYTKKIINIYFISPIKIRIDSDTDVNYIWFAGDVFCDLQIMFMLPALYGVLERREGLKRIIRLNSFIHDAMRIVPVGIKKLHSSGKHLRYAFLSPTRVWCEYNADDGMLFRYVSDKVVIERVSQQ